MLRRIKRDSKDLDALSEKFTKSHAETLKGMDHDPDKLASRSLPYERLDQRTMEILLGVD